MSNKILWYLWVATLTTGLVLAAINEIWPIFVAP